MDCQQIGLEVSYLDYVRRQRAVQVAVTAFWRWWPPIAGGIHHPIQWTENENCPDQLEYLKNRWEPITFRLSRLRRNEIHQWYIIQNLDADVTALIWPPIIPIYAFCKPLDCPGSQADITGDRIKNALSWIIFSMSAENGPPMTTWQRSVWYPGYMLSS